MPGCPNGHFVVQNDMNDTSQNILTDDCNKEWLAPEGAVGEDAEVIINMGCIKIPRVLQMKNIQRPHGGTKGFTIYVSERIEGPWKKAFEEEFPEEETGGCQPMINFELK